MRFAPNRLYIESYDKCPNCGVLIYEKPANARVETVAIGDKTYCSQWCVDWEAAREVRRGPAPGPDASTARS